MSEDVFLKCLCWGATTLSNTNMRLFLLPISTRKTLIYCQKLPATSDKPTWLDYGTVRATKLWAEWENKESGWKNTIVKYGNKIHESISFEEWGLKSIPPISTRTKTKDLNTDSRVEVTFPPSFILKDKVKDVLKKLSTQRQQLHKSRMILSLIGMPISAPLMLVPVVPNIPFFYLVFRAWSHWKALSGSRHIEFLLDNNLIAPKPSTTLDEIYCSEKLTKETKIPYPRNTSFDPANRSEKMLLCEYKSKQIAEALVVPELELELARAVRQVGNSLMEEHGEKQRND